MYNILVEGGTVGEMKINGIRADTLCPMTYGREQKPKPKPRKIVQKRMMPY